VSVAEYYLRERIRVIGPKALALAVLLVSVVALQVAFVLGAQDCVQSVDSFLCSFAKMTAG
jgi:hypothetical protein